MAAFYDACLAQPFDQVACSSFAKDNPNCNGCVSGEGVDAGDAGVPAAVLFATSPSDIAVDVSGCIAALSSGDATCKLTYELLGRCVAAPCGECSGDDLRTCLAYAQANPNFQVDNYTVDASCSAAIAAVSAKDRSNCGADNYDFRSRYFMVATMMCGN